MTDFVADLAKLVVAKSDPHLHDAIGLLDDPKDRAGLCFLVLGHFLGAAGAMMEVALKKPRGDGLNQEVLTQVAAIALRAVTKLPVKIQIGENADE